VTIALSTDAAAIIIWPISVGIAVVPGFVYRLHSDRRARTWKVHPCTVTRELDLRVPPDDVRSMTVIVMSEMGIKQSTSDSDKRELYGVSGWSWRSWGQELIVSTEPIEPDGCRVVCITWPHVWRANRDRGAGRLLIDEFVQRLETRTALQPRDI
jgi:hypothetical protein